MKTQVLVARAFVASFLVLSASASFSACAGGEDLDFTTGSGGEGGSGTGGMGGMGGAAGMGGMGGAAMDAGMGKLPELCSDLCSYLASINCQAWPGCSSECVGGFNAPASCQDEFEAMIECWEMNSASFQCTMNQLVPPPECQALEEAFNDCFSGIGSNNDGGMGCMPQQGVCNKQADSCSCKTNCAGTDLKWACKLGAQTWSCSCYATENDVDTLLGTCTQVETGCMNNAMGCCEPFFVGK